MKTLGLAGKTILVTGINGFLGSNLRKHLLDEGAYVLGIDIKSTPTASEINILDENEIDEYVAMQEVMGSKIHGLVNNAAISFKGKDISKQQFNDTVTTNIEGTYNMINKLMPIFTNDVSVVNISSIYGSLVPDFSIYENNIHEFNNVSYGSSKAAIEYMTKYYAKLYAPKRFNCVAPGGIWNNHSGDFVDKYSKRTPLKRMANVDEITNAILFLLSPLASYITGITLSVDGGRGID